MKKNIYIDKINSMVIKVDSDNMVLLSYSFLEGSEGSIIKESEGILQSLDKNTAEDVEHSLDILLEDYNVQTIKDG